MPGPRLTGGDRTASGSHSLSAKKWVAGVPRAAPRTWHPSDLPCRPNQTDDSGSGPYLRSGPTTLASVWALACKQADAKREAWPVPAKTIWIIVEPSNLPCRPNRTLRRLENRFAGRTPFRPLTLKFLKKIKKNIKIESLIPLMGPFHRYK